MAKNNIKEIFKNVNFGFLILALILGYFLFLIKNDIVKSGDLKNDEKQISVQIKKQEELKKELSRRIKLLDQNEYIEKLARDKLGLIKQGESAYKVIIK